MNHAETAELLGAYALDAVDEAEAVLVAAHVAECPQCAAELGELREVAAMLGNMGGDAPSELWERIASQATAPGPRRSTPKLGVTAPARRHRRGRNRAAAWAASVAAVVVVALVIGLMAAQISNLNTKVGNLAAVTRTRGILLAEQAALLQPSTQRIVLGPGASTPGAHAEVVLVRSGLSYFVNGSLGALPKARTYQLWAVTGTKAVSLGLLGARPGVVPFMAGTSGATGTFAVTVEGAGGAVAPTSAPVVFGSAH